MKKMITGITLSIALSLPLLASEPVDQQVTPVEEDVQSIEDTPLVDDKADQKEPTLLQIVPQMMPPDIECILKSGVLKVAIYGGNVPPFFLTNKQGEFVGIDIDIAKQLAEELGVKLEFTKTSTFDGVVELVRQGKVNVGISKLSVTLERGISRVQRKPPRAIELWFLQPRQWRQIFRLIISWMA